MKPHSGSSFKMKPHSGSSFSTGHNAAISARTTTVEAALPAPHGSEGKADAVYMARGAVVAAVDHHKGDGSAFPI
jgi:hypothetical protein